MSQQMEYDEVGKTRVKWAWTLTPFVGAIPVADYFGFPLWVILGCFAMSVVSATLWLLASRRVRPVDSPPGTHT